MSTGYGRIAFTPAVQAQQERHGSKCFYDRQAARPGHTGGPDPLTDEVRSYLATNSAAVMPLAAQTITA